MPFMKRIMKQVDLVESVESFEDRFLPEDDKEVLLLILKSMQQGQKVQLQKIKAFEKPEGGTKDWSLQDKENISSTFDMFGG